MRTQRIRSVLVLVLTLCLLTLQANAGQDINFAWDGYVADPITGFKLYMGSAPGVATVPANLVATIPGQATTTYTQVNTPVGKHYWVLTAYTATLESGPSNEVTFTVNLKPPGHLTNTVVMSFSGQTIITVANRK